MDAMNISIDVNSKGSYKEGSAFLNDDNVDDVVVLVRTLKEKRK